MFGRLSGKKDVKKEAFENRVIFRDWGPGNWFQDGVDPSLSALLSILETFGEEAFDTEKAKAEAVRALCEAWIDHLTTSKPAPTTAEVAGKAEAKDWKGLSRWISSRKRDEKEYVEASFTTFRSMLWDFIRELGAVVNEDRSADRNLRLQLNELEGSVQSDSITELRSRVLSTVRTIHTSIEKREAKRTEQTRELGVRLRRMKSELAEARSQMVTDPLTNVYNRRSFDEQIQQVAQFNQLSGSGASLLILDVDNFKAVNDRLGHQAGDAALKYIADCCVRSFPRQSDYIARYGGDEFVVIIDESRPEICRNLGRRLLDSILERPLIIQGTQITLAASVGVACLVAGETPESWFKRADSALRLAKMEGKNHLVVDAGDGAAG